MNVTLNPYSYNNTKASFKSHFHEEQMRIQLEKQEQQAARELKQAKSNYDKLNEQLTAAQKYPKLDDSSCKSMAAMVLNFTCSILNESQHNIEEFFGTEEKAEELRSNLSPKCKLTSLGFREKIQNTNAAKDPVHALVSANRLKDFMPKRGILSDKQYNQIVDAAKSSYINLVKNGDLEKFEADKKDVIYDLLTIIETTDGLDFGDNYRLELKKLIDDLNSNNPSNKKQVKIMDYDQNRIRNLNIIG